MGTVEELRQETIRFAHLMLQGKVENELPIISCIDQLITAAETRGEKKARALCERIT